VSGEAYEIHTRWLRGIGIAGRRCADALAKRSRGRGREPTASGSSSKLSCPVTHDQLEKALDAPAVAEEIHAGVVNLSLAAAKELVPPKPAKPR
jgi:hypothetical protein